MSKHVAGLKVCWGPPDENTVVPALTPENARNGGFPDPPAEGSVRVVTARHEACGEATRVRLPAAIPPRAVRRVHCSACDRDFETDSAQELEDGTWPSRTASALRVRARAALTRLKATRTARTALTGLKAAPRAARPPRRIPRIDPSSRAWRVATVPVAALAVVAGLLVLQEGDPGAPTQTPDTAEPALEAAAPGSASAVAAELTGEERSRPGAAGANGPGSAAKDARIVRGSSFSLALPAGWKELDPSAGATFAAASADGSADVSLWIEEDPKLEFSAFVSQSLDQLESLTGSPPQIAERVAAPTPDDSVVRLAASVPADQPAYEVTLRAAGPYRYYLATTVEPGADRETADAVELVTGSFTPELRAGG